MRAATKTMWVTSQRGAIPLGLLDREDEGSMTL